MNAKEFETQQMMWFFGRVGLLEEADENNPEYC